MPPRPGWDEYFLNIAKAVAARSTSHKKAVGAVLVQQNHIIATGYNGVPPGTEHVSILVGGREANTIHAEENALADTSRRGVVTQGAVMYITHNPCFNCLKKIIASGVVSIVYAEPYNNREYTDLANQMISKCGVNIRQVVSGGA